MDDDLLPAPAPLHFDTVDARLAAAGVSLVRRETGEGAGWHLSVPTDAGRHHVAAPLNRSLVVPARLRRLVAGWTRGAELVALTTEPTPDPVDAGDPGDLRRPKPGRPARLVVHARLVEQRNELLRRDADVRLDLPDAVHRLRVACRRLRGALTTFRDLLDPESAAPVRAELRWVARALGPARDAEVSRERVLTLVAQDTVPGQVRRTVDARCRAVAREARVETLATLSSERYFRLLAALDDLVADPSWTDAAERPARTLGRFVLEDWRQLRRRVRHLEAAREAGASELDIAFHEARRRAKRLRYAVEAVEPVMDGRGVRKLGRRAQELTRLLGDLQDTVVVRGDLEDVAEAATAEHRNAFALGRLHLAEELRAGRLHDDFDRVWRRLTKAVDRADLTGSSTAG